MELLKLETLQPYLDNLQTILLDAVEQGAAIGFLPLMSQVEAQAYWLSVDAELQTHQRQVLAVRSQGQLVGAVQIACSPKANALHRCDVEKLMVLSTHQHQGFGRALMHGVERVAASMQRQLLILDVRVGDVAEQLFQSLEYQPIGRVPRFSRNAGGRLEDACWYYKEIPLTHEIF